MEFELLGDELKGAIEAYVGYLRKDGLPMPSLKPDFCDNERLRDSKGVAARDRVLELAKKIYSMAVGPRTELLIISHQVPVNEHSST